MSSLDLDAPGGGLATRHRISVLVVEDSLDHRTLMQRRLLEAGMVVTAVATAEEALEALDRVDLVLLDYRLPRLSGLEVLRRIREHPAGPSVVMVTGMGSTDVAVEAMREGAIDYLAKHPGYLQELPEVIERAWRHHDLARRAGQLQRLALLVNSATAREEVFSEIVGGAVRLLEAESCVLMIDAAGAMEPVAQLGPTPPGLGDLARLSRGEGPDRGGPRVVGDTLLVSLPREHDEPIGLLAVRSPGVTAYQPGELELAQAFAAFAGIALHNLRRRELEEALVDELQRTVEARRDFVASVSHELRTPLTSISGFTETMLYRFEGLTDDQRRLLIEKIHVHATELEDLVEQLIDVASIERGRRFTPAPQRLRLDAELAYAIDTLEKLLEGRRLELEVEPVAILADRDLLRRAVTNLVSNAAKFSDPGTPIVVRAARADGHARIEVVDRGVGLHPREAARVFDPFFRAASSVSNAVRGSGIGLSLVQEYVRTMDGTVGVESAPGEGATFWFTLPLAPPIGSGKPDPKGAAR